MNKKHMITALTFISLAFNAQNEKGSQVPAQGTNGTTVVRHRNSSSPYSYEKRKGNITVHCYTQEQFDKLSAERKAYYQQHAEQYQIIKSKK